MIVVVGNGIHAGLTATALASRRRPVRWLADDAIETPSAPILLAPRPSPGFAVSRQLHAAAASLHAFLAWLRQECRCNAAFITLDVVTDSGFVAPKAAAVVDARELWNHTLAAVQRLKVRTTPPRRRAQSRITYVRVMPTSFTILASYPEISPMGRMAVCWTLHAPWRFSWTFPWREAVYQDVWVAGDNVSLNSGATPLGMAHEAWSVLRERTGGVMVWMRDLSAIVDLPLISETIERMLEEA